MRAALNIRLVGMKEEKVQRLAIFAIRSRKVFRRGRKEPLSDSSCWNPHWHEPACAS